MWPLNTGLTILTKTYANHHYFNILFDHSGPGKSINYTSLKISMR